MLSSLFGRLFGFQKATKVDSLDLIAKIREADAYRMRGELHEAILLYEECLLVDKQNVELINSLGACYLDVGREREGREKFELAYSLNDAYIPGVANYAKCLIDARETTRALELLEHIHICEPDFGSIFAIYAALCFKMGDTERARYFYIKGWLSTFDSLRMANAYLFPLSYCGTEQETAVEHRFWAATLRDTLLADEAEKRATEAGEPYELLALPSKFPADRKLRIGYWSPDLRNHSVRYFFRPLLENHDRSRFEVHLYHDCFASDAQTEAMKVACDHFHDVFMLNDVQLFQLMRSHQLDILVEMAGHTSMNRLLLFKNNRFAALQITGIGYPPTTGLLEIDAKIVDRFIANENTSHHYAEKPMVLPSSFWCYDPMGSGDGTLADKPPAEGNGFVTFACVGNIAKISTEVMGWWVRILDAVPGSRLAIRSINFEDPNAKAAMIQRMTDHGFDMTRVDMLDAQGGVDYFNSYNEIDIILDTYPFNGGTTTCFATYMGVPVITRAGDSLISRMGLSAMANLGFEEWVAHTDEAYVEKAIAAAKDAAFLRTFKRTARARFKETPLGNGQMFARDFEQACETFLRDKHEGLLGYQHDIPPLPAKELMRRAYGVWRSGNMDGAVRIVNHCLGLFPDHGGAHLFVAQQLGDQGQHGEAIAYLSERLLNFEATDQVAAMIVIIRWLMVSGDLSTAGSWLTRAEQVGGADSFDDAQLRLYRACLRAELLAGNTTHQHEEPLTHPQRVVVLVPCDDPEYFDAWVQRMQSTWTVPVGCSVQFVRCGERVRGRAYQAWLSGDKADVVVIMQWVAEAVSSDFLVTLLASLSENDAVSVAGATRWTRSHWRGDDFGVKSAGFVVEARDAPGMYDVQCLGASSGALVGRQAILDGVVLGVRVGNLPVLDFDDELVGVGWALEEDWTYRLGLAGGRLAVHRGLGVFVRPSPDQARDERYPGLLRLQEKYHFPLFSMEQDDGMVLSAPLPQLDEAVRVLREWSNTTHQRTKE